MRGTLQEVRWALARLTFIVYLLFSVGTLVGGFLTAPLMTWYFFGDWRFWRHWRPGIGLLPHALRLTAMILVQGRAFMFSVPLTSPPRTVPDPANAATRPDWAHGESCGDCSNCCRPGDYACPLLDSQQGLCRGYDSFYWRYFNCGRYPSFAEEIHFYNCRKWALKAVREDVGRPVDLPVTVGRIRQQVPCEPLQGTGSFNSETAPQAQRS